MGEVLEFPDRRVINSVRVNGKKTDFSDDGKPFRISWDDYAHGDVVDIELLSSLLPSIQLQAEGAGWGYVALPPKRRKTRVDGFTPMVMDRPKPGEAGKRSRKFLLSALSAVNGESVIRVDDMEVMVGRINQGK